MKMYVLIFLNIILRVKLKGQDVILFHEDASFDFFEYKPKSEIKMSRCNG